MLLQLGEIWSWNSPIYSSDYYWRDPWVVLNPTLFNRKFPILQLLLKPFLRKFALKMLMGLFVKPFYYIAPLLSWFHEIFQQFLRKNFETKICEFPYCGVEIDEYLSQAFFAKILKNFRENNAIMNFLSKKSLEMAKLRIFAQICAKMALVKV